MILIMTSLLNDFILKNNIKQIHISDGISNHKDTYFQNIKYFDYENEYENTLFWGMYRDLDIELVKSHEGKIWVYWHDNDCNPNYYHRLNTVREILNYKK